MSQEHFYHKRCKRLGYALALSCFLNISLLAFGLYEWQDTGYSFLATSSFRPVKSKLYRQSGKELPTLTQSLRELELAEYDQLLAFLSDDSMHAEGYKTRDLSISMLAARHHFDIQRALGSDVAVKRLFTYMPQDDQTSEIILYPDLSNEQFTAICEFAKNEKWPFTAQGLFVRYKLEPNPELKSLFVQTNEYRCVEVLLSRKTELSKEAIFDFVISCDYSLIKNLYHEMLKAQDFSPDVRRGFLVGALPESAELLFKTDPRFCVHSLTDKQVLTLLSSLAKNPDTVQEYALALLEGPRSKAVWNNAVLILCDKLQLDPQVETRQSILERFGKIKPQPAVEVLKAEVAKPEVPKQESGKPESAKPKVEQPVTAKALSKSSPASAPKSAVKPQKPQVVPPVKAAASKPQAAAPSAVKPQSKPQIKPMPKIQPKAATRQVSYEIVHVVQAGESLWQISKRYGVDVEIIKRHNKLSTDALKPGSTLRIPQTPKKQINSKK